jgi:hypothetical protein
MKQKEKVFVYSTRFLARKLLSGNLLLALASIAILGFGPHGIHDHISLPHDWLP